MSVTAIFRQLGFSGPIMAAVMLPRRKWRLLVFASAVICVVPSLSAVIVEVREYHGKKVTCVHSGLRSSAGRVCGTFGYARVLAGTVKSALETGDTDKRLQIVPDEVFLGDSISEVTATTNQACLRTEIQAGEKWLFYLSRDKKTNALILGYDSPSKPIEQAQQDIATLRHLARLTESGIVTGEAGRSGHKVLAKRVSDGAEYTAVTDAKGHYELELPAGSYNLTANTEQGLWAPEGETSVWTQGCVDLDFWLHTDGRISGSVTNADGKAARYAEVAIVPVSPEGQPFTVIADGQGHFEVGGRQPGNYLVGVGLLGQPGSPEWQSRVYYPGVRSRDQAATIQLGEGEWRTDINLKLPSSTAP